MPVLRYHAYNELQISQDEKRLRFGRKIYRFCTMYFLLRNRVESLEKYLARDGARRVRASDPDSLRFMERR
jgi:hypothetical protein